MITKDGINYFTTNEAAIRMQVSKKVVRNLCSQNLLPGSYKKANGQWLVPESAVEEWIKNPKRSKWTIPPKWWKNLQRNPWVFYTGIVISSIVTLIGLLSVISVIADIGPAKRTLINAGLIREFPSEKSDETLIVIASLYYPDGVMNTDAHTEIRRAIESSARELDVSNIRVQVSSIVLTADDRTQAETLGNRYDASMVIWGADTGVRVTVKFLNLKYPDAEAASVIISEKGQTQVVKPDAYAEFITSDLPSRLTFLSLFALGQYYYIDGKYEESAKAIQQAIDSLNASIDHIEGLGQAYFRLGWLYTEPLPDQEKAISYYTKALEFTPAEPAVYLNRGVSFSEIGDFEAAEADYKKALELKPQFISALSNYGLLLAERGKTDDALLQYQLAINLNPDDVVTLNNQGVAKYIQGDINGALADFNRGIELDATIHLSYNNRAMISFDQKDYQKALEDLNFSINLNKSDARSFFNRGLVFKELGDYESAIKDYSQALILNPKLIEAYIDRGLVYKRRGEFNLALQDFYSALGVDPKSAAAYNNIGIVLRLQGDLDAAIVAYNKAIDLDPTQDIAFSNRGCAEMEMGDLAKSIDDLNRAIELNPTYAESFWCRGVAFAKSGNYEEALSDVQQYVNLNPDAADDEDVISITAQLQSDIKKQKP